MSNSNNNPVVNNETTNISNNNKISNRQLVLTEKEVIQNLLTTNAVFQTKVLLLMFHELQTRSERELRTQIYINFKGFDKNDARYLSEVAVTALKEQSTNRQKGIYREIVIRDEKTRGELSRRLPKYWRQVIALKNAGKVNF